MRIWFAILLTTCLSLPTQADSTDPTASIVALTNAINDLKQVLGTTNAYTSGMSSNVNALTNTMYQLIEIANTNVDEMQSNLQTTADSLHAIADFTVTLENNSTNIVLAVVGALAAGIFIGILSATFLCIPDSEKNAFAKLYRAMRALCQVRKPGPIPIRVEPLEVL